MKYTEHLFVEECYVEFPFNLIYILGYCVKNLSCYQVFLVEQNYISVPSYLT